MSFFKTLLSTAVLRFQWIKKILFSMIFSKCKKCRFLKVETFFKWSMAGRNLLQGKEITLSPMVDLDLS
jgi:hypothetical protein